ncbi:PIN domain-containing protein [Candidatus Micrarchaeota archaeon]|nr:PIN domain-containing protein [Candidatus Micrarchaeota archaeon]
MQAGSLALIDTNVLVYAVDGGSSKHEAAVRIVAERCRSETCLVSAQNLAEFVCVVTEKHKKLTGEQANQFVSDLASNSIVLAYKASHVLRANQLRQAYATPFFDSLLAATMEDAGVYQIITENEKDFRKIPWLTVINPFA